MTRFLWLALFLLLAVEFPWERAAQPLPVVEDACSDAGGTDDGASRDRFRLLGERAS